MFNPSGTITINGITDAELAEILEIKAKQGGNLFSFDPRQLQPTSQGTNSYYTNAVFNWNGEQGLKIVNTIVEFLLKKEAAAKAVGQ